MPDFGFYLVNTAHGPPFQSCAWASTHEALRPIAEQRNYFGGSRYMIMDATELARRNGR